ncbi:hypothetical protein J5Y04_36960 [Kitasatospora sp. RG8]|uniref:hypothetical protein n=1 Tax=Kitasatospora sp. RG8 TaxID=2820815 RepID=UPI001ADEF27D|nr:hypothetical protein [Kitasatospora sp. RG8]MBP0455069.1 hypothetical protein [Kitasatospora sp. RG8]
MSGTGRAGPFAFATPLRAVDRVELRSGTGGPGTRVHSVKVVTTADPYMAGHFPDLPMLPAVFLLEGVRQALVEALGLDDPPQLLEVRSARLLAPMLGGDEIHVDAAAEPRPDGRGWEVQAECTRRDGTPVARLKVVLGEDAPAAASPGPAPPWPEPAAAGPVLDHAAIRDLLPVRHPMLLVDQVVSVVPGREICAVKAVSGSEPCYQGLPEGLGGDRYAYPRTLVFESFGQTAALLWLASAGAGLPEGVLMLAAIRGCRFSGAVHPGMVLRHVVRLEQLVSGTAFLSGEIWAADRRIAVVDSLVAVNRPGAAVRSRR